MNQIDRLLSEIRSSPIAGFTLLRYLSDPEPNREVSAADLALLCGVDPRTVNRWRDGTRAIPTMAVRLIRSVAFKDRKPTH